MNLTSVQTAVEVAEGIATILAIVVGGIWSYMLFVRTRQKYPRASVTHRITHRPLDSERQLVVVDVILHNTGEVLLSLESSETRVQEVLPLPSGLLGSDNATPVRDGSTEVEWPLLESSERTWKQGEFEIEPGEVDQVTYDFIVGSDVETIRVYSYFRNTTKEKKQIGWGLTTLYDLQKEGPSTAVTNKLIDS
jgi:hypothetical protein